MITLASSMNLGGGGDCGVPGRERRGRGLLVAVAIDVLEVPLEDLGRLVHAGGHEDTLQFSTRGLLASDLSGGALLDLDAVGVFPRPAAARALVLDQNVSSAHICSKGHTQR